MFVSEVESKDLTDQADRYENRTSNLFQNNVSVPPHEDTATKPKQSSSFDILSPQTLTWDLWHGKTFQFEICQRASPWNVNRTVPRPVQSFVMSFPYLGHHGKQCFCNQMKPRVPLYIRKSSNVNVHMLKH